MHKSFLYIAPLSIMWFFLGPKVIPVLLASIVSMWFIWGMIPYYTRKSLCDNSPWMASFFGEKFDYKKPEKELVEVSNNNLYNMKIIMPRPRIVARSNENLNFSHKKSNQQLKLDLF